MIFIIGVLIKWRFAAVFLADGIMSRQQGIFLYYIRPHPSHHSYRIHKNYNLLYLSFMVL